MEFVIYLCYSSFPPSLSFYETSVVSSLKLGTYFLILAREFQYIFYIYIYIYFKIVSIVSAEEYFK